MPVDPHRVKELFNAALDVPEPAERAAFLDRECGGDRELRQRLDALMAAHDQPASALERPVAPNLEGPPIGTEPDPATAGSELPVSGAGQTLSYQQEAPAPASLIGSIIAGRYKLRQEIGEGGMGSVYLAEQTQPVKRAVALKLIKPGYEKALHTSSARLYAEALANDPKLADDRQAQHAYNAACAAALAATGQGKDDQPPDDAARIKLRRRALDWLKAELSKWAQVLDTGATEMKAKVPQTLIHWKTDTDLAGIRDEKELTKLSEQEHAAFKQLWNDVNQLLNKAAGSK